PHDQAAGVAGLGRVMLTSSITPAAFSSRTRPGPGQYVLNSEVTSNGLTSTVQMQPANAPAATCTDKSVCTTVEISSARPGACSCGMVSNGCGSAGMKGLG